MNLKTSKMMVLGLLISLTSIETMAQKFSGKAIYKTAASIDFNMDGSELSGIDQTAIQKQISKAMQQEYTLSFNSSESSYKKVESLDGKASAQSGGVKVRVAGSDGVIYRNTKTNSYTESSDLFGKPFLIKDTPIKQEWTILSEYKQIGKYECQKATFMNATREVEIDSENGNIPKEVVDSVEVVAWFATNIPVNHGPASYWGLPGLILEVNTGSMAIVCTKLTLNPKDAVSIEEPKNGKVISREKYTALNEEKMKEMMEQYNGKGGHRRVMRISR